MSALPRQVAAYVESIGDPATRALCDDAAHSVLSGRPLPSWHTMPPCMRVAVRMAREAVKAR